MLRKDLRRELARASGTADPAEIARFDALAEEWWKPHGAFKVVHAFNRARIDGELRSLDEEVKLDKRKNHTIEVVIDRLLVKPGIEKRLEQSVALAMKLDMTTTIFRRVSRPPSHT